MYIRDLDFEVEKLESTEDVDSARAAAVTMRKDWLDIKSVDVSVQKGVSNLFSSARAQREKLEIEKKLQDRKAREASEKYHKQGEPRMGSHCANLTRVSRFNISSYSASAATKPKAVPPLDPGPSSGQTNLFAWVLIDLQSQEYGTKYWTAVQDVGMVMESFANYHRYARRIGAGSPDD